MKKKYIPILILTFLFFSSTTIFAKDECKEDTKKFCADVKKEKVEFFNV
jgi:hypothetical protein